MELHVTCRTEWREWLSENHLTSAEVWLVYYKKPSGKQRVPYSDAVEEAICFGWIDGIIKTVNAEYYIQRFTPRRRGSKWSRLNFGRAEQLIALGLMAPAGLKAFQLANENPSLVYEERPKSEPDIPQDLKDSLKIDTLAYENFLKFPSSGRRNFINWLNSAVKSETRLNRIERIVEQSKQNISPGML